MTIPREGLTDQAVRFFDLLAARNATVDQELWVAYGVDFIHGRTWWVGAAGSNDEIIRACNESADNAVLIWEGDTADEAHGFDGGYKTYVIKRITEEEILH